MQEQARRGTLSTKPFAMSSPEFMEGIGYNPVVTSKSPPATSTTPPPPPVTAPVKPASAGQVVVGTPAAQSTPADPVGPTTSSVTPQTTTAESYTPVDSTSWSANSAFQSVNMMGSLTKPFVLTEPQFRGTAISPPPAQRTSIHNSQYDSYFDMMGKLNKPATTPAAPATPSAAATPTDQLPKQWAAVAAGEQGRSVVSNGDLPAQWAQTKEWAENSGASSDRLDTLGMLGTVSKPLLLDDDSAQAVPQELSRMDSLGMLGTANQPLALDADAPTEPTTDSRMDTLGMLGTVSPPLALNDATASATPSDSSRMDTLGMLGTVGQPLALDPNAQVAPIESSRMDTLGMLGKPSKPLTLDPTLYRRREEDN